MEDYISELPDCVLSYILSMLSMKDLLKTSVLSRRWCKLWYLRRDLNFDIHNVVGSKKELLEAGYLVDILRNSTIEGHVDLDASLGEFVNRVDQFLKNFEGTKIDTFLVRFYLNYNQSNIIDQWISFAIAKGVGRISLLFLGMPYEHFNIRDDKPYKFPFGLFSKSNASTLKHIHLQHCLVCPPINFDFIPFTNLRSLTLEDAKLDEMFITSLLSNCLLLEDLRLVFCEFKSYSMPKIISSSLCHLEVTHWFVVSNNVIEYFYLKLSSLDCLKLTSLEYSGCGLDLNTSYFNTPMLKIIDHSIFSSETVNAIALFATLPELEILHLDIYYTTVLPTSINITQPLKHLKQLNFTIDFDDVDFDLLWILTILRASLQLQKLSVTVKSPEFFENQNDTKDIEIFSHEEIKVIEMGGCVGNWYEIEFVMNVLKYARKLERIVLSPYWKDDDDGWKSDPMWFHTGRERIREKIHGEEVIGQVKLI